MHTSEPTVFIVDDDVDVRATLERLVSGAGLQTRVFSSAEAFLEGYSRDEPGCLVLDLRMPGMGGLALQEQLRNRGIELPIIVVTAHADVPAAVQALKGGAVDFLEKPFQSQALLERIRNALQIDAQRREELAGEADVRERVNQLTPREREVLDRLVTGASCKQIAAELEVSLQAISLHRGKIFNKMGVDNVVDLTRLVLNRPA